jgi:hypothetical protein
MLPTSAVTSASRPTSQEDEEELKDHEEADIFYLQVIMATFLVLSAILVLYTTLSDPLRDGTTKVKGVTLQMIEHLQTQQQHAVYVPQELVRIHGLDVMPLNDIFVSTDELVHETTGSKLHAKRFPDPTELRVDEQRRSFTSSSNLVKENAMTSVTSRKAMRRKLTDASIERQPARSLGYTLKDLQGLHHRQSQLIDQLFVAAGYFLAAVFFGVIIIKTLVDGDWLEWRRQGENGFSAGSSSKSAEGQLLMSYGSYGSTDHVSDWSGDFFDRFDV